MLREPEILHASSQVYDSIRGDSNLAFLTNCSANFTVTTLHCALNKVPLPHFHDILFSTVALRQPRHSAKITNQLRIKHLSLPVRKQQAVKNCRENGQKFKTTLVTTPAKYFGTNWVTILIMRTDVLNTAAKRKLLTF
jgi:hypothetical protein